MSKRFIILVVALILYLCIKQWNKEFQRKSVPFWKALVPGAYMILFSLGTMLLNLKDAEGFQPRGIILRTILYFILVAVTEELVFRGIISDLILRSMMRKHMPKSASDMDTGQTKISIDDNTFFRAVIVSVVLSGLIFGLSHSLNLNFAEPRGVMIQVLGTFLMGMVLTGIYYRTGNLAAVIFLHAVNDLAAVFPYMILRSNDTVTNVISNYDMTDVLLLLPYIFVLIVILRRIKVMEILTLYNNQ